MDLDKFYGSLIKSLIQKGLTPKELVVIFEAVELSRRYAVDGEG